MTRSRRRGGAVADRASLWTAPLTEADPTIHALLGDELERQQRQIELVASENFTWRAALSALASPAANKLADGYPGRRDTGGCEVIDEIEQTAVARACALFGSEHANVQPHSGAQANMAVYFACAEPGDTILAMRPDHGGHQTHGVEGNFSARLHNFVSYGVEEKSGLIDFDQARELARQHRPKLVVCGASSYPRQIDALRFREIADEVGALLLCDMAHIAGLVAAGLHPNPTPHCDFVTSTVHKTLAGPRCGGFILCRSQHAESIDRAVYPGVQSAPFQHTIAAKAICFGIAGSEGFRAYQKQVRTNADVLAETLARGGLVLFSGGTDTHLLLVDLRPRGRSNRDAAAALARAGITVNRYPVPFGDANSGLRLGTPAVTMRGFDAAAVQEVGAIVTEALTDTPDFEQLRERTLALCASHPLYPDWQALPG
jgi:glycine hydroxymethyltransferase